MQEITGNPRSEGVVFGQLGTLALREGNLVEAVRRYKEALLLFQRLGEPASEAIYQHQLGRVFQEARQWDQAERHYRESAVLEEHCGNLAGAAQTWTQLANVCRLSDRPQAAEHWYRKAIEGGLATGDTLGIATGLSNLADLLREHPGRLAEARQLAEQSLAIKETLDPGAAEIWLTYGTLAEIADRQSRPVEADKYRHLAHDAKRRLVGPHIK
jgi:tetratricopeptide (TPR) repeat protein